LELQSTALVSPLDTFFSDIIPGELYNAANLPFNELAKNSGKKYTPVQWAAGEPYCRLSVELTHVSFLEVSC